MPYACKSFTTKTKIKIIIRKLSLLLSVFLLGACSKSISGMREGAEHCESFGFRRGTDAYARCILMEEMRYVDRKTKENPGSFLKKSDLLSK